MAKIIYKGYFIDESSSLLLKHVEGLKRLDIPLTNEHVTFELRPEEAFPNELLKESFSLLVIGYGNDGENSGFEVQLPDVLLPYYRGAKQVHITTSVSESGRPKNTGYLKFERIKPFKISGRLGYFIGKGVLYENVL